MTEDNFFGVRNWRGAYEVGSISVVRAAGQELGVVGVHVVGLAVYFDGKLTLGEELFHFDGRIFSINFALLDLLKRIFNDAGLKLFYCLVHVELKNGTSRSPTPRKRNMSRI